MGYSEELDQRIYNELSVPELVEQAVARGEAQLTCDGVLALPPGDQVGWSVEDRFIVAEPSTDEYIEWGEFNRPFTVDQFDALWTRVEEHLASVDHFVSYLHVGNDLHHYIPFKLVTETAFHSLFALNLCLDLESYNSQGKEEWRVLHAPGFLCDPERDGTSSETGVVINYALRRVLLAGSHYAGELKKALFSVQSFLLPEKDVLPLHCSANQGENDDLCIFLGLSGTGKTTLAWDSKRRFIGDDEHAWGRDQFFNLEGGIYLRTADLDRQTESLYQRGYRFGALLENVALSEQRQTELEESTVLVNGRLSFPLSFLGDEDAGSLATSPSCIILLTCDLYGVLPPVAILTPEAAVYHFIAGYSMRLSDSEAGAETGVEPTFSAGYSAPFMPRSALEYAELLNKRLAESESHIYLLNTGWRGAQGHERMPLALTRRLVTACQQGEFLDQPTRQLQPLNLVIPATLEGVDTAELDPAASWPSASEYEAAAWKLAARFAGYMDKFDVSSAVLEAGPLLIR